MIKRSLQLKYIVRFIRSNTTVVDDYYYASYQDAIEHMRKFSHDDSELYKSIQLIVIEDNEIVVTELEF